MCVDACYEQQAVAGLAPASSPTPNPCWEVKRLAWCQYDLLSAWLPSHPSSATSISLPLITSPSRPSFGGPHTGQVSAPYAFLMGTVRMSFPANLLPTLGLTGRVGQHQSWDVASNHSQAGENCAGQDAKLIKESTTWNKRQLFNFSFFF